jgi:hypothetical protein
VYVLKPYTATNHLNEIYQSVAMRFAFCDIIVEDENIVIEQLHDYVKCRDFLIDAMWATATGKKSQIYGFTFDGAVKKVNMKKVQMLISYPVDNSEAQLSNNLKVLHFFEKRFKWLPSKIAKVNDSTYLLVGSPSWMYSPALISLYTLLWRLAGSPEPLKEGENIPEFLLRCTKVSTNDGRYLKQIFDSAATLSIKDPIGMVMKSRREVFEDPLFVERTDLAIGTIHNDGGIVSLFLHATCLKESNNDRLAEASMYLWAKKLVALVGNKTTTTT